MAKWPYNTAQWKKIRRLKLGMDVYCSGCRELGLLRDANAVDHIVAISAGGAPFDLSNMQSLCHQCHSEKTARGVEAGAVRTNRLRRGCKADGSPLDPRHPWATNRLNR